MNCLLRQQAKILEHANENLYNEVEELKQSLRYEKSKNVNDFGGGVMGINWDN